MTDPTEADPIIRSVLEADETVHARALAIEAVVAVTDPRIVVADAERVALNVAIDQIRRVQFDIERDRPATLVIVPQHPDHPPQVLAIAPQSYRAACDALAIIGGRLAEA